MSAVILRGGSTLLPLALGAGVVGAILGAAWAGYAAVGPVLLSGAFALC